MEDQAFIISEAKGSLSSQREQRETAPKKTGEVLLLDVTDGQNLEKIQPDLVPQILAKWECECSLKSLRLIKGRQAVKEDG